MFFAKKTDLEQQREVRLTILQLEKLISRAVNNSNAAVAAFDTSFDSLHNPDGKLSKPMLHVTEFQSADRHVENNETTLAEIEDALKNKQLRTSFILRENLKNVKKKNHHASSMFGVYHRVEAEWQDTQDAATYLIECWT